MILTTSYDVGCPLAGHNLSRGVALREAYLRHVNAASRVQWGIELGRLPASKIGDSMIARHLGAANALHRLIQRAA